jgi:acyl carrier protein
MREQAFALVKAAIEELNEELEYDTLENVSEDTPVYGGDDGIDSLSLVRLVVDLEHQVEESFGKRVTLADEKAMSMRNSPYRSAGALTDFILARLEAVHA